MSTPVPPPPFSVESSHIALSQLQGTCWELRRLGFSALIVLYSNCGDIDVRLQVSRNGCAEVVELLGPYVGMPDCYRWHAVRIEADGRSIWRGPPTCSRALQVIQFVMDLLVQPREHLTGMYQPL